MSLGQSPTNQKEEAVPVGRGWLPVCRIRSGGDQTGPALGAQKIRPLGVGGKEEADTSCFCRAEGFQLTQHMYVF